MTKYTIMQELVKAGCDLDKLPAEILEAIENACAEHDSTHNYIHGLRKSIEEDQKHFGESPKAKCFRLIAEAKSEITANKDKFGIYTFSSLNDRLDSIYNDIANEKYKYALMNLDHDSFAKLSNYTELMAALGELI